MLLYTSNCITPNNGKQTVQPIYSELNKETIPLFLRSFVFSLPTQPPFPLGPQLSLTLSTLSLCCRSVHWLGHGLIDRLSNRGGSRDLSVSCHYQTDINAHPSPNSTATRSSFSRCYSDRSVNLDTRLHLEPSWRLSGAIPLLWHVYWWLGD